MMLERHVDSPDDFQPKNLWGKWLRVVGELPLEAGAVKGEPFENSYSANLPAPGWKILKTSSQYAQTPGI